jgi:transcriptional regulator with XRE-family HTH domain
MKMKLSGIELLAGVLREIREISNLSLRDFADLSQYNVGSSTIKRVEDAVFSPTEDTLSAIASISFVKDLYTFSELKAILKGGDKAILLACKTTFGLSLFFEDFSEPQRVNLALKAIAPLPRETRRKVAVEIIEVL